MKAVYKRRLLKLAEFLRNRVDAKKFNLSVYVDDEKNQDYPKKPTKKYMTEVEENFCGTTACAIGCMPLVFPKDLKYDRDDINNNIDIVIKADSHKDYYDQARNDEAAARYFGLSDSQINYLFMPDAYHPSKRGPKSVARRIISFVRNDGKVRKYTKAWTRKGFDF